MKPLGWILYVSKNLFLEDNVTLSESNKYCEGYLQPINVFISDDSLKKVAYSLLATPRHANRILTATKVDGQRVIAKKYIIHSDSASETIGEIIFFIGIDGCSELVLKNFFMDEVQPSVNGINDRKIKQKTKDVVKMIALGLDRDEVSELFNLTKRGVDYHIDVAKEVLGASNKSSMVFQAMQQGWLTSHQHA
ncbi:hypothetical protein EKG38_10880 [Shewanella canadensis]|uniref:Uncharacterized protein n=1 Tax=Shewanella canadensis TaxID=271096 RepID=A0A3S0IMS6_9GAMM|nr:hypothetical protein [Shewanella canadensis]RTR38676.1 hypothetical protein EKG38_10880 [Shewanella canadensis]